MRRYIIAIFVSLISFYAIKTFFINKRINPENIIVEVNATVLENDIFYVYFLNENQKQWSDEYSRHQRVKGSKKEQKITFVLPLDGPLKKIRIDIGANKEQQSIKIESIAFKSKVGHEILSDRIQELFNLNVYVEYQDGYYVPKVVSGRYDPFLVSQEEVNSLIKKLGESGPFFGTRIVYLLAFIFSLSLFVYLSLSPLKLKIGVFTMIFILTIISPIVASTLKIEPKNANLEKRELAKMPKLSLTEEFPKEFEAYYDDNFGLRNAIIQLSSKIKINVFRSSPKPELVQFGKNEFLFYNSLEDEIFNSYTNQNLLEKTNLDVYYNTLRERRNDLEQKGIEYLVGFWPNKHSIYPEMLPRSMKSQLKGNFSLADQIVEHFKRNKIDFFDVRTNLIEAKHNRLLYRKFDTHWNSDGAFIAYRSFCEQTYNVLGLTPYNKNDFEVEYTKKLNGDLTEQIGVDHIVGYSEMIPIYTFKDESKNYKQVSSAGYPKGTVVTKNPNALKQQRLLVFRDSFTSQMLQFISLHFKEVIYMRDTYDRQLIEKIKPDIVISCRVERYMLSM